MSRQYEEVLPVPGRTAKVVEAVRVLTQGSDSGQIADLFAFLGDAWECVDVLDHPPRVHMQSGSRGFTTFEGEWIVRPHPSAYFKLGHREFTERYKPLERN